MPWVIDVLSDEEWPRLRRLRERALLDTPDAFWATWEDERTFTPDQWGKFASSVTWFVARVDSGDVALAGVVSRPETADAAEVIGMWVDPGRRRRGTARALLTAVDDWALRHGAGAVVLWVVDHNAAALAAYTRLGFLTTGETAPMPASHPAVDGGVALAVPAGGRRGVRRRTRDPESGTLHGMVNVEVAGDGEVGFWMGAHARNRG